jgi:serine/threonine-protein kinase
MAYVDGGSLRDLVAQGPVEAEYAISIASQLADALDHAHQRGLVHRDVKPNNVLMSRDGRPMLTDFGIAKALHESTGLTRTGTSIGTPEYMAPEQIQGQKVDGRTDIYALGIVLYEMLAGWVPFSATTPVAALYKQVNEPPPPLRQVNIAIPDWLEGVVLKALSKSPQDRYQRASDFADALRQHRGPDRTAAAVATPSRRTPQRVDRPEKAKRSMVPILVGGIVVLLLILIAVVAYLVWGGGTGPGGPTPYVTRVVPRESGDAGSLAPVSGGAAGWQVVEDGIARQLLEEWQAGRAPDDGGL